MCNKASLVDFHLKCFFNEKVQWKHDFYFDFFGSSKTLLEYDASMKRTASVLLIQSLKNIFLLPRAKYDMFSLQCHSNVQQLSNI